jgi:hypothetical protein
MDNFDSRIRVSAPFYLMRATVACWKCGADTPVIGLAATTVEQDGEVYGDPKARPPRVIVLRNIADMPYDLLHTVRAYQRRYVKRDTAYYENECQACGINIGDFHLFSGREGPFSPTSLEAADEVEVFDLPVLGTLELEAEWGEGGSDLIFGRHPK